MNYFIFLVLSMSLNLSVDRIVHFLLDSVHKPVLFLNTNFVHGVLVQFCLSVPFTLSILFSHCFWLVCSVCLDHGCTQHRNLFFRLFRTISLSWCRILRTQTESVSSASVPGPDPECSISSGRTLVVEPEP